MQQQRREAAADTTQQHRSEAQRYPATTHEFWLQERQVSCQTWPPGHYRATRLAVAAVTFNEAVRLNIIVPRKVIKRSVQQLVGCMSR